MLANIKRYKTGSALNVVRFMVANGLYFYGTHSKEVLNFATVKDKSKTSYLKMIGIYTDRTSVHRRGHVEFIYAALKHMEEFGVHRDLNVYKALIDVMPKGKFIPENIFQAEFMHYPKQQQCIVDVLEQMEDNGVMPDVEMQDMLVNIFGKRGFPLRKYWRMMYWMPKFKYASPWYVPDPLPAETIELAKLAINRISSVDLQTTTKIHYSSKNIWIVSAQSPSQIKLINKHDQSKPIYVEGPQKVWLRKKSVDYFILKANPDENISQDEQNLKDMDDVSNIEVKLQKNRSSLSEKTVHEQEDGTILAICATETSNKDSLLSWIRYLEKEGNPNLAKIPIVFRLKSDACDDSSSIANL